MHKKIDLIQVLRGFAALIVVLAHVTVSTNSYFNRTWLNDIFKVGWFGVDFFFVLSGFIMVYIHMDDLTKQKNIKSFFLKRFIRIYPIYWIVASLLLLILIFSGKLSFSSDLMHIIRSYLLIEQHEMPFLRVAWSLIYECFFYLIFGVGIFFGLRVMKFVLVGWLILIFISNFFESPITNLFIFNARIIGFLFGCIIAYLFLENRFNFSGQKMVYTGIFLLIFMWWLSSNYAIGSSQSILSRIVYGLSSSLIIWGVVVLSDKKIIRVPKVLLLLGDASYAIYLIHTVIFSVAYTIFESFLKKNSYLITFFGFGALFIALLIGIVFHLLVEKNIIYRLNKLMLPKKQLPGQNKEGEIINDNLNNRT